MGAGATIPSSEGEALDQGYSQAEIDEYIRTHPEVCRRSDQVSSPTQLSSSGDISSIIEAQESARREALADYERAQKIFSGAQDEQSSQVDYNEVSDAYPQISLEKLEKIAPTTCSEFFTLLSEGKLQ